MHTRLSALCVFTVIKPKNYEKGNYIMSTNEKEILRGIMHDLKSGFTFGKDHTWDYYNSRPMRFPYFSSVLYVTPSGNIGYTHFGSSAIKPTMRDLEWLITVIFNTTPSGFLREYIRNDESKIIA